MGNQNRQRVGQSLSPESSSVAQALADQALQRSATEVPLPPQAPAPLDAQLPNPQEPVLRPAPVTPLVLPTVPAPAASSTEPAPVYASTRRPSVAALAQGSPSVQSLIGELIDQRRLAGQKFYLLEVSDSKPPITHEYDTTQSLIAAIQTFLDADVAIFVFMGHQLGISKGPHRYLVTPFGTLPLFSIPDPVALELEEHGWMGKIPEDAGPPEEAEAKKDEEPEVNMTPSAQAREVPPSVPDEDPDTATPLMG